ncbi:MAG: hypothetical protein JXQ72_00570, partial [Anaerolineae bacterium]|nr:hypothetical protein [Anaerolineae bacterium]
MRGPPLPNGGGWIGGRLVAVGVKVAVGPTVGGIVVTSLTTVATTFCVGGIPGVVVSSAASGDGAAVTGAAS